MVSRESGYWPDAVRGSIERKAWVDEEKNWRGPIFQFIAMAQIPIQ